VGSCCWRLRRPLYRRTARVSRPWNIYCLDHVGVFLEAALPHTRTGLEFAVVRRHMTAGRTSAAGVARRDGDKPSPSPRQLVFQLAAELEPVLIEDGFVAHRAFLPPT